MTYQEIATAYEKQLAGALTARAFGNFADWHAITDAVIEATGCELWELVEALDIVRQNGHDYPIYTRPPEPAPAVQVGLYAHRYANLREPWGSLSGDHPDVF